ncbi:MAG: hypothetical protein IKZ14_03190 [Muribaculaceae bacterium]|nr:hypothetical protein [Muribaculaceae bacterium]
MRIFAFIFGSILLCSLVACDDSVTIGNSLISDEIEIVVDSSYTVSGQPVANSKILSRSTSQLLGVIDSKGYGSLRSDVVAQFMPAGRIDTTNVKLENIDSMKLKLVIPINGFTGDSITPMGLKVYKLNKQLPSPIYSDFDPTDYYSPEDLVASKIYAPNAVGQSDSIANLSYRYIDINLPVSLAHKIYNKYIENPSLFSSPSEFAQWFPGIYISNSFGCGRIVNIIGAEGKIYYHKTEPIEDTDRDTTYYYEGNYFAITPEVISNNNINLKLDSNVQAMIDNNETVIVAPTGYDVKITFPAREIIEDFRNNGGNISVINGLSLEIPAENIVNDNNIGIPPYLLMVKSDKKDEFFEKNQMNDDLTSFYAAYDSSRKSYTFPNLRSYLLSLLKQDEIKDEDIEFTLTPIGLITESSTSNNSYYYGYYSSGSTTTTVNGITPYVVAPKMAKLNLDKAKVIFTYSKQTIK